MPCMETSGGIEKNNHFQLKQKQLVSPGSTVACSCYCALWFEWLMKLAIIKHHAWVFGDECALGPLVILLYCLLLFVCSKILSLLGHNFLHFIVELLSTIRKWDVPTLCKSFIELSLSTVSSSATLHYGNKIFDSPLGKMEPNLVCFSAEDPR